MILPPKGEARHLDKVRVLHIEHEWHLNLSFMSGASHCSLDRMKAKKRSIRSIWLLHK